MRKLPYVITILFFTFIVAENLQAIPAFARKYRISCQTCHTPVTPKLKDYGDAFAGNGFKLEDYEAPRYFVGNR